MKIGLRQEDFAKLGGAALNSQSRYEQGDGWPKLEYLLKLEEHGVDVGYVVTGRRDDGSLGYEDSQLLEMFGKLTDVEREAVMTMVCILTGNVMRDPPKRISPAQLDAQVDMTTLHAKRTPFKGEELD